MIGCIYKQSFYNITWTQKDKYVFSDLWIPALNL